MRLSRCISRIKVSAGVVVALAGAGTSGPSGRCSAAAPASAPAAADAMHVLRLDRAVAGGKPLVLRLGARGGEITQAWGLVTTDNLLHVLDCSRLKLTGDRVSGEVRAFINSVVHVYTVDAAIRDPDVRGTFRGEYGTVSRTSVSGAVTGELAPRFAQSGSAAMEMDLGKIVRDGNGTQRRTTVAFSLKNGQAGSATITSGAGEAGWTGKVDYANVEFAKDELRGTLAATIASKCPTRPGVYLFSLNGRVIGTAVLGKARATHEDWHSAVHHFFGSVKAAADGKLDPQNAAYTLELAGAVDGAEPLKIYMERAGGAFRPAVAVKHTWFPHEADASALKLTGDRLRGQVRITVQPQGWRRRGHCPVAYLYDIDAQVKDATIKGTFTGRPVIVKVRGDLAGSVRTWDDLRRENALADGTDYPCWRGPAGSGSSVATGHELVDLLQQARPVWKSEEPTPDSWLWSGQKNSRPQGGYSSPVVADGRVFLFYFVPTGAAQTVKLGEGGKAQELSWVVDADDVMLCADAATGRTLWKTVLQRKGLNVGAASAFMTPHVHAGKVYGIGSAGKVYCLDAATGAVVWESDLGPEARRAEKIRQDARKSGRMAPMGRDFCASPTVVDGVVVCNDNAMGLIGLDARTGKQIWGPVADCASKTCTPVKWTHKGTNYVLAAGPTAVCVEPKTGKLLWRHDEVCNEGTIAVSRDHIVCSGGGKRRDPGNGRGLGINCHRISPTGAETAWYLPYNNHVTSPLVYNGHVYAIAGEATLCIELETGKIVASAQFPGVRSCSSLIASDGRIFREHLYQQLFWFKADPADFRQLGPWWQPPSQAECTTAVITDGRLFLRGRDCLYCYDLRKDAK